MKSLEDIATNLLEGKISHEEAERLSNQWVSGGKDLIKTGNIVAEEDFFEKRGYFGEVGAYRVVNNKDLQKIDIFDEIGISLGYIDYFIDVDSSGENYIFLDSLKTLVQGKGLFSKMFNKLIDFGRMENCSHFELEVDSDNVNALEIYKHLGFYSSISDGFEAHSTTYLRRDL